MHDVFVSYASTDRRIADAACARLERAGVTCWIAPRDITPGRKWPEAILDAIEGARILVLLLSKAANNSTDVAREVQLAASNGLHLIPVRVEDVQPVGSLKYFLTSSHWLDASSPALDLHLDHLVVAVQSLLPEAQVSVAQEPNQTEGAAQSASTARVFPLYVVCDVSMPMWSSAPKMSAGQSASPLGQIEESLRDFIAVTLQDEAVSEIAHLGIIAFGDVPEQVLPLTPVTDRPEIRPLPRRNSRDFACLFGYLDQLLRSDHDHFASWGLGFFTPMVLLIVSGESSVGGRTQLPAEWMPFRSRLEAQDHPFKPVVVAIGVGTVRADTVRSLRSTKPAGVALIADEELETADVLRSILGSVRIWSEDGHAEIQFKSPKGVRRLS